MAEESEVTYAGSGRWCKSFWALNAITLTPTEFSFIR